MASPILLLHFDEGEGVAAADALGNLDDLAIETGIVAPSYVEAWTGRGRAFDQGDGCGLLAGDISANGTYLARDVTIQALIALTLTGATGPQTIIARGLNDGSTPERYAYGLEVEEQAAAPGYVEARLFWQDASGTIVTAPPGVFKHPGDGAEFMLTASRRWEAPDRIVVRYYVGEKMIAELVESNGSISGGVTGTMSIGARKEAGAWDRFLNGTIDELLVLDFEMSPEEVLHTWRRLAKYQPDGQAMFAGLAPPGVWWFDKPDNGIGKRAKIVGQSLGLPIAATEEFRDTFLPDRCPLSRVPRWERLCGLAAMPMDTLDVRRARVVAHLASEEGYSIPALQTALANVLDLEAEQVEILEFENEVSDGFDTSIEDERWGDKGSIGTWSIDGGKLKLLVASGTAVPSAAGAAPNPCHLLSPLDHQGGLMFVQAKIVDYVALPAGSFVGLCFHERITNRSLFVGVYNNAGTIGFGYREIDPGAASFPAFTSIATIAAGPIWIRVKIEANGTLSIWRSTAGPSSGFTLTTAAAWPNYNLVGFAAYTTSTPGADIVGRFDDFVSFTPDGLVPFVWFAYRDPLLLGSPDMIGANAIARKVSPAHMFAAACSSKSLLCDDAIAGLVERTPMGADL